MAPWLEISEVDIITFIKDYRNSSYVKIEMKQAGILVVLWYIEIAHYFHLIAFS